jgi:hypothetical protein
LVNPTPQPLYAKGKTSEPIGGWVGAKAGLDVGQKRKNLLPVLEFEPCISQPVAWTIYIERAATAPHMFER